MSTIIETTSTRTNGTRRIDRTRVRRRRRDFGRAFALGAAISAVAIGGAWAVVGDGGGDHTARNGARSELLTVRGRSASTSGSAIAAAADQHGASVVALQHELAQLSYYEGPIDGVLGPATLAAIINFQRANGLGVDGIAGASTIAKIHQQLVTGDSQMSPTAPPVRPAKTNPSHGSGKGASTTPIATTPSGGASTNGGQSGTPSATASATTTPATGGTSVAP